MVSPNKGSGPKFGEIVNIFDVNGARKVKPDAQVAMNDNSDPVQKCLPLKWLESAVPLTQFFRLLKLSETSRARKLIFGLRVIIDMTLPGRCI